MKRTWKIFFAFLASVVLLSGLLLAGIAYLYRHPSISKSLIERAVSASTGADLEIADLSYSAHPLELKAKGIRLSSGAKVLMTVPELILKAHREGGLGRGTLVMEDLKVKGPLVSLERTDVSALRRRGGDSGSPLPDIGRKLVAFFLFRRFELRTAEVMDGSLEFNLGDRTLSLKRLEIRLDQDRSALITLRAEVDWPGMGIRGEAREVRISTEPLASFHEPEIRGSWHVEDASADGPMGTAQDLALRGRFSYRLREQTLNLESFSVEAGDIAVNRDYAMLPPHLSARIEGRGSYTGGAIRLSSLQLQSPGLLQAAGSFESVSDGNIRITLEHGQMHPGDLIDALHEKAADPPLPSIRWTGPVTFSGTADGRMEGGRMRWECKLEAGLEKNELSLSGGGTRVHLPLDGTVRLSGAYPTLATDLLLESKGASFEREGLRFSGIDGSAAVSGTYPSYTIKALRIDLPEEEKALLRSIRISDGRGKIDLKERALGIDGAKVISPLLGQFDLSLSGRRRTVRFHLSGEGQKLIRWPQSLGTIPANWEVTGTGALRVEGSISEDLLHAKASVSFSDVGFQDPDFTYTAQGIGLRSEISGTVGLNNRLVSGEGSLLTESGELLLGRFYFDLDGQRLSSRINGSFDMGSGALHVAELRAGLKNLIELRLKGDLEGPRHTTGSWIDLTVPDTDLSPLFRHLLQAPFESEKPFLAKLHPSGSFSADLHIRMEEGSRTLTGYCRWKNGGLDSEREDFKLQGVDLTLPIWYRESRSSSAPAPLEGRLSIESLRLPLLSEKSLDLPLIARPNLLDCPSTVTFHAFGGSIQLGPFLLRDLASGAPRALTGMTVRSVDLSPLLSPLWGRSVPSVISGKLDPVRIGKGELQTVGGLKAKIFGGELSFENIGLSRLGAAWPDLRMNVRIRDLDMADLTRETPFGKIDGVLRGKIDGLEVAYGQPQRFDLFLQTVKKKGVPQKISLKAVDNISRLGGGGSPFVGLAGAFASLFKEFPYKKIGVAAHLENDVFTINGTIKEDGREYLVKRAAFSGVNVINQNPDNRISFKDMLKRLKRVTSDGEGPVIR